jgi:hypothetical protein
VSPDFGVIVTAVIVSPTPLATAQPGVKPTEDKSVKPAKELILPGKCQ